ncbi:MAG: DUF3114 domain-containing protein [Thomasclavelia sp.]|nr:DUF3114 domain-containing protein [Thomasclavelia sp.]
MGYFYNSKSINNVKKSIKSDIDSQIKDLNSITKKIKKINSDSSTSETIDNTKELYSNTVVLIKSLKNLMNDLVDSIDKMNNSFTTSIGDVYDIYEVNEDGVIEQINHLTKSKNSLMVNISNFQTDNGTDKNSSANGLLGQLIATNELIDSMIKRYQAILDKFKSFYGSTASFFTNCQDLNSSINQSIESLKNVISTYNGKYDFTPLYANNSFCNVTMNVNDIDFNNVKIPSNMTVEEKKEYLKTIVDENTQLKKDGWDKPAINGYFKNVTADFENQPYESVKKSLLDNFAQTKKVGSKNYQILFDNSKLPDNKIVDNMIKKQMGGYMDSNGNLKFKKDGYKFDANLSPFDDFWNKFSMKAVVGFDPTSKDFQHVSQFRMYIDRQNINYVRTHGVGNNDYEKLVYCASQEGKEINYDVRSYYHDRNTPTNEHQINDKLVVNDGHCEFIVDSKDRNFVTQWDALKIGKDGNPKLSENSVNKLSKEDKLKIVNSESFNFIGVENDDSGEIKELNERKYTHKAYDMKPVSTDSNYEYSARYKLKNEYSYNKQNDEITKDDYN